MQDARDEDASGDSPVKYDVAAMLHTLQIGAYIIAGPAEPWIAGKPLAT